MIVEIMMAPLVPAPESGVRIGAVVTATTLTAALAAIGLGPTAIALFGVAVIAIAVESVSRATDVVVVALVLRTLFLAYVTVRVVWRVIGHRVVTHDTVAAVACGYVLIGLVWGGFFALLETFRPGSFTIPAAWMTAQGGRVRALTYFSFVILSTVGLGDIVPTGPQGGGLCAAEAVVGQLYLAIMIARMVGILASQRSA